VRISLDDVAVVIVNHKTLDLTRQCLESLRNFYSDVLVYLVDNGSNDASTEYVKNCKDSHVVSVLNDVNSGHGGALHQATELCQQRYLFTLDSDTIVRRGGFLEAMRAEFDKEPSPYAVGYECETDQNGYNTYTGKGVRYIHPFASMYDLWTYRTLRPFIHHGAPAIENMIDANVRMLGLVNFPITRYIEHLEGGTSRRVGGWSKNVTERQPLRLPFVSFVTRAYARPAQLLRCLTSIARQSDPDYENVIIVDEDGVGVEVANGFYDLPQNRARVRGQYVHLIDDDDIISDPDFVATIKDVASHNGMPEVIVIRVRHPNGVILPTKRMWMQSEPIGGHIGGSGVVVRRDVWLDNIHHFGDDQVYWGDFVFISELFRRYARRIYWLNRVMVEVPSQNQGAVEQ
jgi:glycosyltransferase involved in cell wall biosynthesis